MKQSKHFRLSQDCISYLESYAKEHHITQTEALEKIIAEHSSSNNTTFAKLLSDETVKSLSDTLTRIRLAANGAERNSMIMLEMINSTAITYNIPFISTEEKTSATLQQAQETVRNRIANYKQRSDWRKKGK